jgi:predicted metal-dependent hydrolase
LSGVKLFSPLGSREHAPPCLISTPTKRSNNEDPLGAPPEFRRRVIVEELLHLKVPNHGKLFKALLKSYLAMD